MSTHCKPIVLKQTDLKFLMWKAPLAVFFFFFCYPQFTMLTTCMQCFESDTHNNIAYCGIGDETPPHVFVPCSSWIRIHLTSICSLYACYSSCQSQAVFC